MFDILGEITKRNERYNNNITKISVLEEENDRLMAEICCDIQNSKNDILKEIKDNQEYLNMLSKTAGSLDVVIKAISNNEVNNISIAKLVIEVLLEIEKHDNSIKNKKKSIREKNINKSNSKGFLNKFTEIVKGDLENDN